MHVKVDRRKASLDFSIHQILGDSGGPIQFRIRVKQDDIFYIVGVTSFGASCGSDIPGIYTRVNMTHNVKRYRIVQLLDNFTFKVSEYLDWIEQVVWPEAVAI